MFIGYFTERPYQDPKSGYFGATGKSIMDLNVSNEIYDAELGAAVVIPEARVQKVNRHPTGL